LQARLIFATHRDWAKWLRREIPQDLFYRINVMRVVAPPLQEHSEDIPRIAKHFLGHYAELFQKPMRILHLMLGNPAELLVAGNVRSWKM